MNEIPIPFAFFGSSRLSVLVLERLAKEKIIPKLIITTPDKAQGRKLEIKPNIVKEWALKHKIPVFSPEKLDKEFIASLATDHWSLFIVASFGKIIPKNVLELPKFGTVNIHPSLLPEYRGPSPLQTTILDNKKETGVSIIIIDEMMDHGPIIAQEKIHIETWPNYEDFEEKMANIGTELLIKILPALLNGKITKVEQDHSKATFTKKFTKQDGLIDINDNNPETAFKNFLKIQAFHEWPQAYFIIEKNNRKIRVKIKHASWINNSLVLQKVIPEGKKEMDFEDFKRGYN